MNFDERVDYLRGMVNRANSEGRPSLVVPARDFEFLLDHYQDSPFCKRPKPPVDTNKVMPPLLPALPPLLPALPPLLNLPPLR